MAHVAELSPLLVLCLVAAVAAAGGLLPFSPIEPLLAGVALTHPAITIPAVLLAATSQVAAKCVLFSITRRAARALKPSANGRTVRLRAKLDGRPALQRLTVLGSAIGGFPPFYAVTITCALLSLPMRDFAIAGTVGRAMRFATVALLFGTMTLDAQERPRSRETFVLISGIVGGSAGFDRLEGELTRRGHRVIVIDPYAMSIDSADVTFGALARRVERVLDSASIVGARLVGHAHGGGVMLRVAAANPERASALYLLDVGALPENRSTVLSGSVRLVPYIMKIPYGRAFVRGRMIAGLRDNAGDAAWLDARTERMYTEPMLDDIHRVIRLATRLTTAMEPEPVDSVVARIRVLVTVILGTTPRAAAPVPGEFTPLARLSRGLRVESLPGVGHFPHEEAPARVADLLVLPTPFVIARNTP